MSILRRFDCNTDTRAVMRTPGSVPYVSVSCLTVIHTTLYCGHLVPSFSVRISYHLCDVDTGFCPLVSTLRRFDCNTDTRAVIQTLGSVHLASVSGGLTVKQTPL